jgi:fatty acid desaturase
MAGMDDVPPEILRAAYQRKPAYLLKVPLYYAMWAGGVAVLYATKDSRWAIPIGVAVCLVIANLIRGLGSIAHDAIHGTVTKNKTLAYVIGLICWAPSGMSVTIYQNYHLHHHRITNTYPDVDNFVVTDYTRNPLLARALLMVVYTFGYPTYFMFQMFRYIKRLTFARKVRMNLELAGFWGLVGVMGLLMPLQVFIFSFPLAFVFGAVLASVTSMIEHYEMPEGDDAYGSRTYCTKNPIMAWIWNNVPYHVEHHKFPGIPWYNLKAFHEAAYPHYDEKVKANCHPGFFGIIFHLYGRILKFDVNTVETKYQAIDRNAERQKSMTLPGIESAAA